MLDHPGWLLSPDGRVRRAFRDGEAVWTVVCDPAGDTSMATVEIHSRTSTDKADILARGDWFDPASLPDILRTSEPIRDMPRIRRIRNPDLWDALLPPILCQRQRVDDASRMYRRLCEAYGRTVKTEAGLALLAPRPDTVAELPDSTFSEIRLRGKAKPLRMAAEAYLSRAQSWTVLTTAELFADLQTIPYVGRWTAGVAIADATNDYSFYAFAWPSGCARWQKLFTATSTDVTESQFKAAWAQLDRQQLSTLVLLALASALPDWQRSPWPVQ
jgi:DNA-3-methyladenine glycosylase II